MKTITAMLLCVLVAGCVAGCSPAAPITDEQVKLMTAHCASQGKTVKVFNGGTSQISCD
jgi:hypothetical protein